MLRLASCVSSLWNCTFLLALVLAFLSMPKLCTFVSPGRNYFEFEHFNISKKKQTNLLPSSLSNWPKDRHPSVNAGRY